MPSTPSAYAPSALEATGQWVDPCPRQCVWQGWAVHLCASTQVSEHVCMACGTGYTKLSIPIRYNAPSHAHSTYPVYRVPVASGCMFPSAPSTWSQAGNTVRTRCLFLSGTMPHPAPRAHRVHCVQPSLALRTRCTRNPEPCKTTSEQSTPRHHKTSSKPTQIVIQHNIFGQATWCLRVYMHHMTPPRP